MDAINQPDHPALAAGGIELTGVPCSHRYASPIAPTPSGLVAAWAAGTHERRCGVKMWVYRGVEEHLTNQTSVACGIGVDGNQYPPWNPVLFHVPGGPLLLSYVDPDPHTWWGFVKRSSDQVLPWSDEPCLTYGSGCDLVYGWHGTRKSIPGTEGKSNTGGSMPGFLACVISDRRV